MLPDNQKAKISVQDFINGFIKMKKKIRKERDPEHKLYGDQSKNNEYLTRARLLIKKVVCSIIAFNDITNKQIFL